MNRKPDIAIVALIIVVLIGLWIWKANEVKGFVQEGVGVLIDNQNANALADLKVRENPVENGKNYNSQPAAAYGNQTVNPQP
jgi:hypothetical protein